MSLVSLANEFHAAQPGLIIIASLLGTLRQPDRITAREALLEEEAGTLTRKAIQMAKDGDTIALRLCLDTMIYPARKDRPMKFALLPINSPRDAADIMVTVAKAVAAGDVTTNEASEFAKVIETYVKAFYVAELDERVARVEQLSDAELMRIAMGGQAAETVTSVSRLLTLRSRQRGDAARGRRGDDAMTSAIGRLSGAPPAACPVEVMMAPLSPPTLFRQAFRIRGNDDLRWVSLTYGLQVS